MTMSKNFINTIMLLVVLWTTTTCQHEGALDPSNESMLPIDKSDTTMQPSLDPKEIDTTISTRSDSESKPTRLVEDFKIYEGCGSNKTCFGYPYGCDENKSCFEIASATARDNFFEFELMTSSDGAKYIALGLSIDQRMGDDLVTECINDGGNINMMTSFTWNYGNTRVEVPQNKARLIESTFKDGVIYCRFERDASTSYENHTFDLLKNNYFLLLAVGTKVKENGLGYHDISRTVSLKRFPHEESL